ncbi:Hypothetical predicted protein, partial [Cloeon dipterum]
MEDPPKRGTKKYNVISGKDKNGRLETKPALILHGPGTFIEMQEMLKLRKLETDCTSPGERPKRIRRLPAKNLETADEDDEPRSPSKKSGQKKAASSNMQADLLNAISRAKEIIPTSEKGPGDKQGNLSSREKMTISKKSTQGKRSLAGTLDDEESQVNRSKDKLAKPRNDLTRVERGHSNIRSTSAGQSRPIPEKGKEKTNSRAAGGTDEEENGTFFEGPGDKRGNLSREKMTISKKSTQGKRSLAGTLDDEESQVNRSKDKLAKPRNDLTRVERGHSNIRSTSAGQS